MTHGQLFAGIGGFGLAARWAGIQNLWANEIDSYCCKLLRQNFPDTSIHEKDIREFHPEYVDIISGGFPCQPFSTAGKRGGTGDNRFLWPEMLRVIASVRPQWVIGENVAGLLSMGDGKTLDRILTDLEDQGYHTETFLIPASATGAWHRRERLWIIGHTEHHGSHDSQVRGAVKKSPLEKEPDQIRQPSGADRSRPGKDASSHSEGTYDGFSNTTAGKGQAQQSGVGIGEGDTPNPSGKRPQGGIQYQEPNPERREVAENGQVAKCGNRRQGNRDGRRTTEPGLGGLADGIPDWLDEPAGITRTTTEKRNRVPRIKGLGNAIVPQVAYQFFRAIKQNGK